MSELTHEEVAYRDPAGRGSTPPAGPALSDMVVELARTRQALEALMMNARADSRQRFAAGVASGQTDSNGDAALKLFEVPQGAIGHLMLAAVDAAGVTPAAPVTSANLWHAIFAGPPGDSTAAQIFRVGNLMDCQPLTPAADAQIPYSYTYASPSGAPTLRGPESFWMVLDAATASIQVACRWAVLIEQPDS